MSERCDIAVVGGGIVGLATARALLRARPGLSLLLIEKEDGFARHQSGRNSGVVHTGIYYRPGSFKARTAVFGARALERYCAVRDVPFHRCGKVIVATLASEISVLGELERRGTANGVRTTRLVPAQLHALEPHARGLAALHVPEAGVVDFGQVCRALVADLTAAGATLRTGTTVRAIVEARSEVAVETDNGIIVADGAVNCAGLHADALTPGLVGPDAAVRIVPFRGEYYDLAPCRRDLVRGLIYPVPEPALPFLGAHLSRDVHGRVHAGPNAVLALAREGYGWGAIDRREIAELVAYRGFRRLARRRWTTGAGEVWRSLSTRAFVHRLRRLLPELGVRDLVRGSAGVRAQAVASDGTLIDDFVIRDTPRAVHVVSAPSPAATASLALGAIIARRLTSRLGPT